MTLELDQALSTGDGTAIDEALNEMNLDEDLLFGEDNASEDTAPEEKTAVVEEDKDLPEVIDTTKTPDPKSSTDGSGDQIDGELCDQLGDGVREIDGQLYVAVNADNAEVMGKNGKHSIPYSVLDKARNDGFKSQQEAEQLREKLSGAETNTQKMEMLSRQLEEAGITPDKLPEELLNDPSAIEALQDELGGTAGQLIAALVSRIQGQQPVQQNNPVDEIDNALSGDGLEELRGWEQGDKDRWDMAVIIDEKLKTDPEFNAMPLNERFIEVQRRVKATFGDPVQATIDKMAQKPADQAAPEQQPPAAQGKPPEEQALIPNSPSSLGGTASDTTQAAHQALASQDAFALESSLEKMSPEAVEEFLANAALALD